MHQVTNSNQTKYGNHNLLRHDWALLTKGWWQVTESKHERQCSVCVTQSSITRLPRNTSHDHHHTRRKRPT